MTTTEVLLEELECAATLATRLLRHARALPDPGNLTDNLSQRDLVATCRAIVALVDAAQCRIAEGDQ